MTAGTITTDQSAVVTATLSGVSKTATISLAAAATLSSLACTPTTLGSSAASTCTVTLSKAATASTTVTLSDNSSLLTTPASVSITTGAAAGTFTVTAGTITTDQSAVVTATLSGVSKTATISLTASKLVPTVVIDSLLPGMPLSGTVTLKGWALESTTGVGLPISSVKVQVDGILAGSATYGTSRADICAQWPGRPGCPNVGFTYSLNTASFSLGSHSLRAVATDSAGVSGSWTGVVTFAAPAPTVKIDSPTLGAAVSGKVVISGGAIDNTTSIGTPISSVKVLVDGATMGTASYGLSRPDVCALWPGRPGCPNVGYVYSLNTAGLMPGTHTITVSATNSIAVSGEATATILVGDSSPDIHVDSPTAGSVVSGTINVSGWAVDSSSPAGATIGDLKVLVDGTTMGTATYGASRPDVCASSPGRPGCPNVGFTYSLDTAGLSLGIHTLTLTAATSGADPSSAPSSTVSFTVGSVPPIFVDSPTAGTVVSGMVTVTGWTTERLGLAGRTRSPILVKVDGNLVGNAVSGFARPEVCRLHRLKSAEISSADASQTDCSATGFAYLLDTRGLAPGLHTLTVSTTGAGSTPDADSWTINFDVPAPDGNLLKPGRFFTERPQ